MKRLCLFCALAAAALALAYLATRKGETELFGTNWRLE
jgi:hypothetical protein